MKKDHILVCLSSAPSNERCIHTAVRIAQAFHADLTALYVRTSDAPMSNKDEKRLYHNIELAKKNGAKYEEVHGTDVPYQIAEFAHMIHATQIILGQSIQKHHTLFPTESFIHKLSSNARDIDIYVIPDTYLENKKQFDQIMDKPFSFQWSDVIRMIIVLIAVTAIGLGMDTIHMSTEGIMSIYILGILMISVMTTHFIYGYSASILTVFIFNYFFTEPRFTLRVYDQDYWITFISMFIIASITSSIANRLKVSAQQANQSATRIKVLFDTSQQFLKAQNSEEIIAACAKPLQTMLKRDIVVYLDPETYYWYSVNDTQYSPTETDIQAMQWVFKNNAKAGARTDQFPDAQYMFYAIRINTSVYGVIGIENTDKALDVYANSVLLSILGECALALENEKNAKEKEEAKIRAENEHLRANLLRTISHDLRTPLTSISGNASNLYNHETDIDPQLRKQLYMDIYDDSMWLIHMVENLLSISRIENNVMPLHLSIEVVNDVIDEAIKHISRDLRNHVLIKEPVNTFLMAEMDARLVIQVLINLINNSITHTPDGTTIVIQCKYDDKDVFISVADDGLGISDEDKEHVFEMFYSGNNISGDSQRSTGLGLALCRSIIHAHGGTFRLEDNTPCGSIFTFSLHRKEIKIDE